MSSKSWRLFHSLLSFSMNVKMLNPREVVAKAEAAGLSGAAPLAAVEGFIRKILGWREFMRGFYWAKKLAKNPRIAMVYQQLKKMDAGKIEAFQVQAASLRGRLDQL